jgi:hypothetical protein
LPRRHGIESASWRDSTADSREEEIPPLPSPTRRRPIDPRLERVLRDLPGVDVYVEEPDHEG